MASAKKGNDDYARPAKDRSGEDSKPLKNTDVYADKPDSTKNAKVWKGGAS